MDANRLSRGLGWFSVGLGLKELSFSEQICQVLGVRGREGLVRALGVREVLTGMGLLMQRNPSRWLWGRVAGNAIDLTLLGAALRRPGPGHFWRLATTVVVAGATVVDLLAARRVSAKRNAGVIGMELSGSVPLESWRGSGLAEDVGVGQHDATDEAREQRIRAAEEHLGLLENH